MDRLLNWMVIIFIAGVMGVGPGILTGVSEARTLDLPPGFVLNAGYFEFSGLTYTGENGEPAGFVNDITVKTLDNAGIPYKLQDYSAARFFKQLEEGDIHFFNGLSSIPVVNQNCISSDIKLFPLEMRVYWRGDKDPIAVKEDLIGHSVILVRGFTYKDWGAWIREGRQDIAFYDVNTHESAFKMLKRGRAEYLLNYKYIDSEMLEQVEIPDLQVKTLFRWYCYFNIHKDTPDARALLKTIEDSYKELIQKGELKKYE